MKLWCVVLITSFCSGSKSPQNGLLHFPVAVEEQLIKQWPEVWLIKFTWNFRARRVRLLLEDKSHFCWRPNPIFVYFCCFCYVNQRPLEAVQRPCQNVNVPYRSNRWGGRSFGRAVWRQKILWGSVLVKMFMRKWYIMARCKRGREREREGEREVASG